MKSIEKRIKRLEEVLNISEIPSYREYMNDLEGRYDDVDLNEILKREKINFDIFVIHDLIERDDKIELFKGTGEIKEY